MASYDTSMGRAQFQGHSIEPYDRGLRVSWSGIVGGTALGWAAFSLLMLVGAAIGFAKLDPMSSQPANGLGAASGAFGAIVLILTSFFGAYMAVRIAGTRRSNDALLHGGICWAVSMLIGAVLALGAARTAAQSGAAVASGPRAQARMQRESDARSNSGPTTTDRQRASDAADAAAKTTGAGAGGAALALAASLVGALVASRRTGRGLMEGLRRGDRPRDSGALGTRSHETPMARDEAVIVPPRS